MILTFRLESRLLLEENQLISSIIPFSLGKPSINMKVQSLKKSPHSFLNLPSPSIWPIPENRPWVAKSSLNKSRSKPGSKDPSIFPTRSWKIALRKLISKSWRRLARRFNRREEKRPYPKKIAKNKSLIVKSRKWSRRKKKYAEMRILEMKMPKMKTINLLTIRKEKSRTSNNLHKFLSNPKRSQKSCQGSTMNCNNIIRYYRTWIILPISLRSLKTELRLQRRSSSQMSG